MFRQVTKHATFIVTVCDQYKKQPFEGTFLKDKVIEQSIMNQLIFSFTNALQNLLEILEDS